jgi:hypothetical protein
MFCTLKDKALNAPLWIHATATVVSFAAFQGTRIYLDHLYAASGHPVGFATGQLVFDGATIFGYYETMRAAGTFGTYVQTQMFDFAFIASVIIFGICLGTLIARMGAPRKATYVMGIGAAFFAFMGGSFDALENLTSFGLMQFENAIPQVLAYIYSSFAALKFTSLTVAMALAFAALITGLISGGLGLLRPRATA